MSFQAMPGDLPTAPGPSQGAPADVALVNLPGAENDMHKRVPPMFFQAMPGDFPTAPGPPQCTPVGDAKVNLPEDEKDKHAPLSKDDSAINRLPLASGPANDASKQLADMTGPDHNIADSQVEVGNPPKGELSEAHGVFSAHGGLFAFATSHASSAHDHMRKSSDPDDTAQTEIGLTQEIEAAAIEAEKSVLPSHNQGDQAMPMETEVGTPPNSRAEHAGPLPEATALLSDDGVEPHHDVLLSTVNPLDYHAIQVIHDGDSIATEVQVHKDATVGSITVAEDRLTAMRQPIMINTCLGTRHKLAEVTQPMQQIFLREAEGARVYHSCSQGHMPKVLESHIRCPRIQTLYAQEAWVANDEMHFYLNMIEAAGHVRTAPILFFPLHCEDEEMEPILQRWICTVAPPESRPGKIVTALRIAHHWFPVALHLNEGTIQIFTTPAGRDWMTIATRGLGTHIKVHTIPVCHTFPNDCGFQTVGWLMSSAFDPSFASHEYISRAVEVETAIQWRSLFERHLHTTGEAVKCASPSALFFGGTLNQDLQDQVRQLLLARGVNPNAVDERTQAVIERLGRQPLARALRAHEPWKEIKQLANYQTPKLQLVLPSEMQVMIENRVKQGKEFGSKRNKAKGDKNTKKPIAIQADDVSIPEGIFCDCNGQKLSQIAIGQIGPESSGVVVTQATNALPYLRTGKPFSKAALAFIVINHHQDPLIQDVGETIRFPAKCERTGEAILLAAKIIQMGAVNVIRVTPTSHTKVDEVQNRVVRTVSYRDELEGISWPTFLARPIKHVIAAVPQLQPDEDQHSPILDVWDRQYLNDRLERCRPAEATIFMACFRIEARDADEDVAASTTSGHYMEPRTSDGRSPDPAFRVVWLNKVDRQGVILASQQTQQWNSIVMQPRCTHNTSQIRPFWIVTKS